MSDGPIATLIREKLTAAFAPQRIDLEDDSWKHAGHHHEGGMDAKDGGESHFQLTIVSDAFEGQGRVARQRAINAALKEELAGPVHALAVRALTVAEAERV
ncbi:BolA family transcriptional regulator [Brevundimonas sp. P7753]|uniref:BolA family protein n=1 Tax=Brevundimonas sp. P7753 TaxID=2726982 RepID=UPI0015BEB9D2|nr:BolA family protein [Brevundimonas sp. P7753]NWE50825.1 BolA family transcriptional regulator [Brevundimonas sp. P7753]